MHIRYATKSVYKKLAISREDVFLAFLPSTGLKYMSRKCASRKHITVTLSYSAVMINSSVNPLSGNNTIAFVNSGPLHNGWECQCGKQGSRGGAGGLGRIRVNQESLVCRRVEAFTLPSLELSLDRLTSRRLLIGVVKGACAIGRHVEWTLRQTGSQLNTPGNLLSSIYPDAIHIAGRIGNSSETSLGSPARPNFSSDFISTETYMSSVFWLVSLIAFYYLEVIFNGHFD